MSTALAEVNTATGEIIEYERETALSADGLEAITRGEIVMQMEFALRHPRSINKFYQEVKTIATLSQEIAESCVYALPRGKNADGTPKIIEGPSVRLAEIVANSWKHMRVGARIVGDDGKFITAQGFAWDLENNVAIAFEVKRRITYANGARYNDDMIVMTGNAASSIALRNAIFRVIPRAYVDPLVEACKKVIAGDAKTLDTRRALSIEGFKKMGVPPERVFHAIGVKGIEDVTLDHLTLLNGYGQAIRSGEASIDTCFPPITQNGDAPAQIKGQADLKAKLMNGNGAAHAQPQPQVETAPAPAAAVPVEATVSEAAQEAPAPEPEPPVQEQSQSAAFAHSGTEAEIKAHLIEQLKEHFPDKSDIVIASEIGKLAGVDKKVKLTAYSVDTLQAALNALAS